MAKPQDEIEDVVLELTSDGNETLDELVKETRAQVNEETLKEAYDFLLENEPSQNAELEAAFRTDMITTVTIRNITSESLTLMDHQNWDGAYYTSPPPTIDSGGSATFLHTSIGDTGAKGGVVYSGRLKGDFHVWLLAWHDPRDDNRKVYARVVGPLDRIVPVNWDVVERDLDASSSSINVQDPSGAGLSATIEEGGTIYAHSIVSGTFAGYD